MSTTRAPDTVESVQQEVEDLHAERVKLEDKFREDLRALEIKIRNATARLTVARAAKAEADAKAAIAEREEKVKADRIHAAERALRDANK